MTKRSIRYSKLARRFSERYLHYAVGLIIFSIGLKVAHVPFGWMQEKGWDYGAIYSAIFDLSTVYTAILFAFVIYFRTTKSGFLKALPPRLLNGATQFAKVAFEFGLAVIVCSIPLIIWQPLPAHSFDAESFIVSAWSGLTGTAIAAFFRASRIFWIIMSGDR